MGIGRSWTVLVHVVELEIVLTCCDYVLHTCGAPLCGATTSLNIRHRLINSGLKGVKTVRMVVPALVLVSAIVCRFPLGRGNRIKYHNTTNSRKVAL